MKSLTVWFIVFLGGCTAMFVPTTSDPMEKLMRAGPLIENHLRPLPAQQLIFEAIDICTKENNQLCLAQAYRQYGLFLRSDVLLSKKGNLFRKDTYWLDPEVTYETRYEKSIEYFLKAIDIFTNIDERRNIPNIYYNLGRSYIYLNDVNQACKYFDKSISTAQKIQQEYKFKYNPPDGYESFEDAVIKVFKEPNNCP